MQLGEPLMTNADAQSASNMPVTKPSKVIRSLQVIPGKPEGYCMIHARREAEGLRHANIEVRQYFLSSRTNPLILTKEFLRFRRVIREFRPDVVHVHFGTVTALFCALTTSTPLLIVFRGSDLNPTKVTSRARSLLGRLFSQLAALRAAHIVCVTKQLRERLWWRRNRVTVIAGSMDMTRFYPISKEQARTALGWDLNRKVVLFNAGKQPLIKRLDLAEATVEAARQIVGDITMAVLRGDVEPNDIPLYLNAADCLLITSDWEGSPYIVKEALCCNLPVVSVDTGDVAELCAGVTACHIVPRDIPQLAQAVAEVVSIGTRCNGQEAMRRLSQEKVAGVIRTIYEQILRRDPEKSVAAMTYNSGSGFKQA